MIREADRESFAAAAEVAVACGLRYAVAARWREHAFAGPDAMASRRRLRSDPLRLRPVLLAEAAGGRRFADGQFEISGIVKTGDVARERGNRRAAPLRIDGGDDRDEIEELWLASTAPPPGPRTRSTGCASATAA